MAQDVHCPYSLPGERYKTGQVTRYSSRSPQAPCITHSDPGLSTRSLLFTEQMEAPAMSTGGRKAGRRDQRVGWTTYCIALPATPVAAFSAVA